jgi:hypothetical protein
MPKTNTTSSNTAINLFLRPDIGPYIASFDTLVKSLVQ